MLPGAPGYVELTQLAMAHSQTNHKEDIFVAQVMNMGEALPVSIQEFFLRSLNKKQHCVPIRPLAEYILERNPEKLLAGHALGDGFHLEMLRFWEVFVYTTLSMTCSRNSEMFCICAYHARFTQTRALVCGVQL